MAEVSCAVEFDDDDGQPSVTVTCNECAHSETSKGQSPRSVRRCLALLRENCPSGDDNYYVAEDGSDEDGPAPHASPGGDPLKDGSDSKPKGWREK